MNRLLAITRRSWELIFILSAVLCVLLPFSPIFMSHVYRDSGVFLYTGWRLVEGEIPYLDVWDHKPPIIFFINAIGLAVTNDSRWGVWLIEVIFLFIAAYVGFKLLQKTLGSYPAVFGTFLWLLTLNFVIEGGNLTEEYALPMQFAALYLVYRTGDATTSKGEYFLIGLLGGAAFFTKQTSIGIWIAVIVFLTYSALISKQIKRLFHQLLQIFIGALAMTIPILIYFGIHGALSQFFDAAFHYNSLYISNTKSISNWLLPIFFGTKTLSLTGLFQLSMIGYLVAIILVLFKKEKIKKQAVLWTIAIVDLPIEIILFSLSGKSLGHYYMALLPSLSIFAGLTFWVFVSFLSDWGIKKIHLSFLTLGVVSIFLLVSCRDYNSLRWSYQGSSYTNEFSYIISTTSPEDHVLLWGAESSMNYQAKRKSPTRFVYQYPLYTEGYTSEKLIVEFLDQVIHSSPILMIDTKNDLTPMYNFPIQTESITQRVSYLRSNYEYVEEVGSWSVYRRKATMNDG